MSRLLWPAIVAVASLTGCQTTPPDKPAPADWGKNPPAGMAPAGAPIPAPPNGTSAPGRTPASPR